ncbi:Ribokinase-like protein, partial [Ochromonadaceae sp. CCMP2298]
MRNPISFTKTARFGALGLTVPPSASTPSVLFYGAAGLDLLCFVAQYPEADDKVRALGQLQAGGGNAANSACAAAKLGVDAHICTKIGCDANGTTILQGLQEAGVNTTHVLRSQTSQS